MKTPRILKMKLFLVILGFVSPLLLSCGGGSGTNTRQVPAGESAGMPIATFAKTLHDFGKIFSGEIVTYSFRVSNTGDAPLIIISTQSGCVCVVGEYTREAIPPGGEGRIQVRFDSGGRWGSISETIRVVTNAEPQEQLLQINVEVIEQ
ncbi:MAG TPA: DUF1573 domain-containing protein [Bacteroidales bacterium]|nr:DUF1573 domain-containing protein [Bacteroidales bacterium]